MDAIISAKAGVAIFLQGNEASVIKINDLMTEISFPIVSLRHLLDGANDAKKIKNSTKDKSIALLQKEFNKQRALTMVLIMLDDKEDDETIKLSVECLSDFFTDKDVFCHVENTLYSNALPESANLYRAKEFSKTIDGLFSIFNSIDNYSDEINFYKKRWDILSVDLFDEPTDKIKCEECLSVSGAFKDLVLAESDYNKFSLAYVKCVTAAKSFRNGKIIIDNWLKDLMPSKVKKNIDIKALIASYKDTQRDIYDYNFKKKLTPHKAFENALKQKSAIIPLLKAGDWAKTRRYVEDLISSQLISSDPEHITKSLCDLSQHAKHVNNFSLQLELAKRAIEIKNDDAWSNCQVAESYFCLNQFDNAIEYFRRAEAYGEHEYAQNGYARILKAQGKIDEAIEAYKKLIADYGNSTYIANCYAETLRDAWKINEALSVYDRSITNLLCDSTTYCGKASLLKSIGRLDEALSLFEFARDTCNDSHYVGCGIADIYKIKGDYGRALAEYDKVIKKFPDEIMPKVSRANIHKLDGNLQLALEEYQVISLEFPHDTSSKEGQAEVYKEMKEYDRALRIYNDVITKQPMSMRARNGRANIFKCLGRYSDALQAYDENVKDSPYDIVSWSGRADILKQLGDLDEAINAYRYISDVNPYDHRASYSMAAIYVAKGDFNLALKLLPNSPPQTKEEWFAYHVRGMVYIKSGDIDKAISFYTDALNDVPYYNISVMFKNALAVIGLRKSENKSDTEGAISYIGTNQNDYLKNVLQIHAYGKLGQIYKAEEAYVKSEINCPPFIMSLRDELAAKYINNSSKIINFADWVFHRECDAILLDAA